MTDNRISRYDFCTIDLSTYQAVFRLFTTGTLSSGTTSFLYSTTANSTTISATSTGGIQFAIPTTDTLLTADRTEYELILETTTPITSVPVVEGEISWSYGFTTT